MPKAKSGAKKGRASVRARNQGLVSRARNEAKNLVSDVRRVGERVQKQAEKVVRDFEKRAERLIGTVEARVVKAIEPALAKSFASRRDVQDLRARVAELERQLKDLNKRAAVAA